MRKCPLCDNPLGITVTKVWPRCRARVPTSTYAQAHRCEKDATGPDGLCSTHRAALDRARHGVV